MSDDKVAREATEEQLLRSLCEEARSLASGLRGPLSRLTLQAGDHSVEVEWQQLGVPAPAAAVGHAEPGEMPLDVREVHAVTEERHAIVAPLVGTFYRSPEPNAKPFVEEGDIVEADQDVAIIEAMKIMNRVQADRAGRILKILPVDGEMVEFGQELMFIEPLDAGP
jgi:acetyl-CoA carboxylase biotin carboxyl carrier protein